VNRFALLAIVLGLAAPSAVAAETSAAAFIGADQVGGGAGPTADVAQIAALDVQTAPAGDTNVAEAVGNPTDTATFDQTGVSETALVAQTGADDVSTISQSGDFDYASVTQSGADDYSSIVQSGQGDRAIVNQASDGARSAVSQTGSNNLAIVRQ
jgi:hypothetical protein